MQTSDRFDLTGRAFGRLLAEKCVEGARSRAKWLCRCQCGAEKIVSYHSLTQGLTTSCGCSRSIAGAKDITGQKFGRLTALENTGEKKGTNFIWRCKCDCGNEAFVPAASLLKGNTQSCGCLRNEKKRAAFRDITGQRFGKLTALAPTEKRSGGSVVWKCVCDCGNECLHAAKALTTGKARSCGCLKAENSSLKNSLHYVDGTCVEFLENTDKEKHTNSSGHRGVREIRGKWQARITFKKKTYFLGTYDDIAEAVAVRKQAEQEIFGAFLEWYSANFPPRGSSSAD